MGKESEELQLNNHRKARKLVFLLLVLVWMLLIFSFEYAVLGLLLYQTLKLIVRKIVKFRLKSKEV